MEIDEETRKPRRNIENLSKSEEIDEKEWQSMQIDKKTMNICENRWKSNENRW